MKNIIILGFMRCGTTSVFRYMSALSGVCQSYVKELNFYNNHGMKRSDVYLENFDLNTEGVTIESSPYYMAKIDEFIEAYNANQDFGCDVFPVLIYRRSLDWLTSIYYSTVRSGVISNIDLNGFIATVIDGEPLDFIREDDRSYLVSELAESRLNRLKRLENSGIFNKILVVDFEFLKKNPSLVVNYISTKVGIDEVLDESVFEIENKSITPKYPRLYALALRVNSRFEPQLNKLPLLRSYIRTLHHKINDADNKEHVDDERFVNICKDLDCEFINYLKNSSFIDYLCEK